jgi:hypothetical protein
LPYWSMTLVPARFRSNLCRTTVVFSKISHMSARWIFVINTHSIVLYESHQLKRTSRRLTTSVITNCSDSSRTGAWRSYPQNQKHSNSSVRSKKDTPDPRHTQHPKAPLFMHHHTLACSSNTRRPARRPNAPIFPFFLGKRG